MELNLKLKPKPLSLSTDTILSMTPLKEDTKTIYYICPNCGELTDSITLDDSLCNGGNDFCYCGYMKQQWDKVTENFQPIYFRECNLYRKIPKFIYDGLIKENNTVLRLEMYRDWMRATGKK